MGNSGTNVEKRTRIGALLSWCIDPSRGAHWVGMGVLASIFVGGWLIVWNRIADAIQEDARYRLCVEAIEITQPPPWIRAEIAAEVFVKTSLVERPFALDPDLPRKMGEAFAAHPWVAEVKRVRIVAGPRMSVELAYRKPVAMVDLALASKSVLFPVDGGGISLPETDFTPAEKTQYLRIVGIERPDGPPPPGERWTDPRVLEAAHIARLFETAAKKLDLDRIVPYRRNPGEYEYILCTRQGTCIEWGFPPGGEAPAELTAEEKVAKLLAYADKNGSLEGPGGDPQIINVRFDLRTSPRTVGRSYLDDLLR